LDEQDVNIMKILILDDNESLVLALKGILQNNGHEVDGCLTAIDAIARLGETTYDLILLDYKMPTHDGVWFMTEANVPRTTKVLLMTAYVHRNVINTMFKLGACGYMMKPFDEEELLRNLDFFLPSPVAA
jgi:DNA-binding response OmpR family regulator